MSTDASYVAMMQGWIDVAALNLQMAVAALVLPIVFLRQVLAVPEGTSLAGRLNRWLYASWAMLLLSIGSGMAYQSVATCLIGKRLNLGSGVGCWLDPNITFWICNLTLYGGIVAFVVGALREIRRAA